MCMPCAYNAALEASISDLGREESPKNSPILEAPVKSLSGYLFCWFRSLAVVSLQNGLQIPMPLLSESHSSWIPIWMEKVPHPHLHFPTISWQQDHSVVMEFLSILLIALGFGAFPTVLRHCLRSLPKPPLREAFDMFRSHQFPRMPAFFSARCRARSSALLKPVVVVGPHLCTRSSRNRSQSIHFFTCILRHQWNLLILCIDCKGAPGFECRTGGPGGGRLLRA